MVAFIFAINVSSQETKDYPHAFIGLQGGVMRAYNGQNIDRKWNPMAFLAVGAKSYQQAKMARKTENGKRKAGKSTPVQL